MSVLCSISTRGRTLSTLPMTVQAIINQTRKPDALVIYDDNAPANRLHTADDPVWSKLFALLDYAGIRWTWAWAAGKGQHHNHQHANRKGGHQFVWRVDDDCIPSPTTLETLMKFIENDNTVGAVGGEILTPVTGTQLPDTCKSTGEIQHIDRENNIQWNKIHEVKEVDHLHCSFVYRAGVHDYNTNLSQIAHREETLFTYGLKKKGYRVLVVPDATTYHLKHSVGGIRDETVHRSMFQHDEDIFQREIKQDQKTVVVLNCGRGDHVCFAAMMHRIKNPEIYTCYPDIVPGGSITEARAKYGNDIDAYHNIYRWMGDRNWKGSIEEAFIEMYSAQKQS